MGNIWPGILAVWLAAFLVRSERLDPRSLTVNQALDKRAYCYSDTFGNPYSCLTGYQCCVGVSVRSCIPANYICCDMGTWIGFCPVGTTCSILNGYPACANPGGKTVAAGTPSIVMTTPTSRTPSKTSAATETPQPTPSSGGSGLSQGATIAIVASVTCSVLGLIMGVGIKYYFSKKAVRNGHVP
ncbi:hypothetical protein GGTG_02248 [Gaeumannomyces tritici R3-111a-1]|uniref:Uncharacterized protein n=1 Tax=Gaeumannomyces tritici (strain R3-111a-1) TaxID=644352 RepID=J3NLU8_GAET3|nr:hypothetical protein GGTG_02248 [Gaeumannomyces tritici R3-111a-1]EJT82274.1 hypothetical protein GGTG_02248 [Gaeumannomyces tritici R3-111a-1]